MNVFTTFRGTYRTFPDMVLHLSASGTFRGLTLHISRVFAFLAVCAAFLDVAARFSQVPYR